MTTPEPPPRDRRRLVREIVGVLMVLVGLAAMVTAAIAWGGWLALLAMVGAASFVFGISLMTEKRPPAESGT